MTGTLRDLKIVEFTNYIAGPLITRYLSDLGAEVIKIEGKSRPDPERSEGLKFDFNQNNTGKMCVALNLQNPKGVEIAHRFIAQADAVVENFAGGVMERLGLGYDALRKTKPDIVMLSACMMGQTGPYSNHPGLGSHLAGLAGFNHIAGWPDREPAELGVYTDYIVPPFAALALMAALTYRHRTGRGMYIDVSQLESSLPFMSPLLLDYTVNGRVAGRVGNAVPAAAPHNAYRCRGEDRWCAIAVTSEEEWNSFCQVIGDPLWTRSVKFATLLARKKNEAELDKHVEEWTLNYSPEYVMNVMQAAGVPAGMLQTGQEVLENDPQLKHDGFFDRLEHPQFGPYWSLGTSFTLSRCPREMKRASMLGEDNEKALKGILGMTDSEIAAYASQGAFD